VLGETLPLAALFDWLRGRPWPGAPSRPVAAPPGFEQLGWRVDLARFAEGQVDARRDRAPAVNVRARLDMRG
jgi:outer membrane lipoprotein LolB